MSRLLKSWATPPTSCPMVSSFCACMRAACARSRRMISSRSCSLAFCSARVRCATRCSRSSAARCCASRCARASYCRARPRLAASTAACSEIACMGRSRNETFRSLPTIRRRNFVNCGPSCWLVMKMKGKSDQGGWAFTHVVSRSIDFPYSASSATTARSAPRSSCARSSETSPQMRESRPACLTSFAQAAASRPTGARMRTSASGTSACPAAIFRQQWSLVARVDRRPAKDPGETFQRRPDAHPAVAQPEFADRMFVASAALLHHRKRAAHRAVILEVTQHQHGVAEIADVQRRFHGTDQPVLRKHQHRKHAQLAEVTQQLVHLKDEETLVRHRVEIAVQTVDDDNSSVVLFHCSADPVREFSGPQLRGIDLVEPDHPVFHCVIERQAEGMGTRPDGAPTFIESEYGGVFTAPRRRDRI